MKRTFILPLLAVLGLCIAIVAIFYGNRPSSEKTQGILPFQPPFDTFVAGVGIVEAPGGDIAVGTPVSGVVTEIYVKVGDHVKAGNPLFKIDDSDLQAQLVTARARVQDTEAASQQPRHRLEYAENLHKLNPAAISPQDLSDRRDEAAQAEAALALAKAQLEQLQIEVERHTVHALMSGEILQLKMRLGEFVEGSSSITSPLLLLGSDHRMNVRVDIDEPDAWRVRPGAEAVAYVRGNPAIRIPLRYEYTEPYIVPKTALTGQSTERTDTRVLQVLYSFERDNLPVYAGELLDVYIKAPASNDTEAKP
jgi:RND family efflux transporter MFP subunit